jgi:hypothetical protein
VAISWCSSVWLERLDGVQEVAGSNPVTATMKWKCAKTERPTIKIEHVLYWAVAGGGTLLLASYDVFWRREGCPFRPDDGDKWIEIIIPTQC